MEFKNSIAFTTAIPFNYPTTVLANKTLTGNITLTVNTSNAYAGCGATLQIIGDGSSTVNLSAFKVINGAIDNTAGKVNYLFFFYTGNAYVVSITQEIGALTQLSTPASFAAGTPTSTTIPFTWADVANEVSYVLEISTNNAFTAIVQTLTPAANATSATGTGLSASTTYYARLRAIGNGTTYSNSNNTTTVTATTAAPASWTNVLYPTKTNITDIGGNVWTNAGTTWDGTGLSAQSLAASTNGAYRIKYHAADGEQCIIGFSDANAEPGVSVFTAFKAGVYIAASGGISKLDGGTITATGQSLAVGDYVQVERTGSVFKIRKSADGITWADVTTLSYSSAAQHWPITNVNNAGKMYYPQINY